MLNPKDSRWAQRRLSLGSAQALGGQARAGGDQVQGEVGCCGKMGPSLSRLLRKGCGFLGEVDERRQQTMVKKDAA